MRVSNLLKSLLMGSILRIKRIDWWKFFLFLWLWIHTYESMFAPSLQAQTMRQPEAHIGLLDKITGRIQDQHVSVGDSIAFGHLVVWVRACYRSLPGERNESTAFFEIIDTKQKDPDPVFSGWMFASTPSLSSLEHPVYDLWLISCPRSEALSTHPSTQQLQKS